LKLTNNLVNTDAEQDQIRSQLARIYTPGEPITDPKLFSGRTELLDSLRNQLAIPGKVLILYGERGVGKTSFYNVLLHGMKFIKYSCTSRDTFITIFLNILRSLGEYLTEIEINNLSEAGFEIGADGIFKGTGKFSDERKFAPILPEPLDQASVLRRLKGIQESVDAIVFDEFQKLEDQDIYLQMNDLVKALSDNQIKVRILFVGIAESDEMLLPPSLDFPDYKLRHYMAVKIPRMTVSELEDIIDRRRNIFNIEFDPEVKSEIAIIASGYPFIAHTLALYGCFAWLNLSAGKVVKNWLTMLPFGIGNWLQSQGLKVEKIDLRVGGHEFSTGVIRFLNDFHNNYEKQSNQLCSNITSANSLLHLDTFLQLANSEEAGCSSREVAAALNVGEARVEEAIAAISEIIVQDNNTKTWRLAFPYLRIVIRAFDYLQRKQPEQLTELLSSETALA
jgi:hypothetical protein